MIIIAPYPAKLHTGSKNPKLYPWWKEVVHGLVARDCEVFQIGVIGEERIESVAYFSQNLSLDDLKKLVNNSSTWLSCDSFLPHFCHLHKLKPGVVIWGPSDPRIWGHPENINILKDRKYLRPLQYQDWNQAVYNEEAFVSPEVVIDAVKSILARSTMPLRLSRS